MLRAARDFYLGPSLGASLVRAVVGSAGLRFVGMAVGFLVGVQLARGLGPAGYGAYGLAMSILTLLVVPTEFGLSQLVTREVAGAHSRGDDSLTQRLLRWSNQFVFCVSLIVIGVTVATMHIPSLHLEPGLLRILTWGFLFVPAIALGNISGAALRGYHRVLEGQIPELVIRPGILAVALLCVSKGLFVGSRLTPAVAMALQALSACAGAAYAAWRLSSSVGAYGPAKMFTAEAGRWLSSSTPMALSEGLRTLGGHLGSLTLGALARASDLGEYRVAMGIYTVATLPSALLNAVCSPMLAKLSVEGRTDSLRRLNAWMALALVLSSLGCLLPFATVGRTIIGFTFGKPFQGANSLLLVLLVGELFTSTLGHPTVVLNMVRAERAVTAFSLVSIAISGGICIALAPTFGAFGAALGTAIGQFTWRLGAWWYARKFLGIETSLLAWHRRSVPTP